MPVYKPLYYKKFSCTADKCEDSCCRQWEIIIDSETEEKYKKIKGSFGDKIRSSIITDADGDRCFRLVNGRCPFLNEKGLCDIHINLGHEYTSEVCRQHPDFIEEYDGFTEKSLSMSCPEAARIILESNVFEEYPVPQYNGDDEVLSLLIESRRYLLELREDIINFLISIFSVGADDQCEIDGENISVPDINSISLMSYIKFISCSCEILTDEWKELLEKAAVCRPDKNTVSAYIESYEKEFRNISDYFLYRDYLKTVNDCDALSHSVYIVLSVLTVAFISCADNVPVKRCAELYSKEIEHDTENTAMILEYIRNIIYRGGDTYE